MQLSPRFPNPVTFWLFVLLLLTLRWDFLSTVLSGQVGLPCPGKPCPLPSQTPLPTPLPLCSWHLQGSGAVWLVATFSSGSE